MIKIPTSYTSQAYNEHFDANKFVYSILAPFASEVVKDLLMESW